MSDTANPASGCTGPSSCSVLLESADEFEGLAIRIREHVENNGNDLPHRWDIDDIVRRYIDAQNSVLDRNDSPSTGDKKQT